MAANRTFWFSLRVRSRLARRNINRLSSSVSRFATNARRSFHRVSMSMVNMNNQINRMSSGLKRLAPALGALSIGGAIYAGKSALEKSADLEAVDKSIIFASGDPTEGAKNLEFIKKISKDLALDFESAADGFRLFSASMIGSKFTSEDARKMYLSTGKAIRVMGLGAQETQSVFYALGQMISKGKIQAQELRLQLGNALPGAFNILAESMGVTTKKLNQMLDAGNIDTWDHLMNFTNLLGEKFQKGVPDAMKTTRAQLTLLRNDWLYMTRDIGDAVAKSGIVDILRVIAKYVKQWVKANKQLISTKLKVFVNNIVKFGMFIYDNWASIRGGLMAIVGGIVAFKVAMFALNIVMAANPLGLIAVGFAAIGAAVSYAYDYLSKWNGETGDTEFQKSLVALSNILIGIKEFFTGNDNSGERFFKSLTTSILTAYISFVKFSQAVRNFFVDLTGGEKVDWVGPLIKERERLEAAIQNINTTKGIGENLDIWDYYDNLKSPEEQRLKTTREANRTTDMGISETRTENRQRVDFTYNGVDIDVSNSSSIEPHSINLNE